MKFPKFNLPKIKFAKPKFTVDNVLKWAQYGTYAYIVARIVIYIVQQLKKLTFKKA